MFYLVRSSDTKKKKKAISASLINHVLYALGKSTSKREREADSSGEGLLDKLYLFSLWYKGKILKQEYNIHTSNN